MLVSVVSCHTELLTPALWFAHVSLLAVCSVHTLAVGGWSVHVADDACCSSHTSRPFATTTVVLCSAAVLNMLALLTTSMLAAELSADTPLKFAVAAALMAELAFRLAAPRLILLAEEAHVLDALTDAAPCLTR